MNNPLFDKEFLKQLDYHNNKTVYVKITALDYSNAKLEEIQGRVTGGNINIQGDSAVRRTCSLTLVALDENIEITDVYWAFKNKFTVELGLQNQINDDYPDIIWFKQGVFVINSFSKSRSTNSLNISISGQDKMCLLNGTLGGSLPHETDFGVIETEDENGNVLIEKLTIYNIIKNAILMYGHERPDNIIINDLDDVGYELLEYRGDTPMYLFFNNEVTNKVQNICFETNSLVKDIDKFYSLNTLDSSYNKDATQLDGKNGKLDYNDAYVAKIEYGETAGYHQIPLVYNDDLILKVGEPLTAMFDKIKNMLGNYEYFYDIDGRFVFQKKRTYTQELFDPVNGEYKAPLALATPYSYQFNDTKLFTTISNNPKVDNIKNDYSIWGVRKSISGSNLPIHVRYAIDDKPLEYKSPYDRYAKVNNLYYIVATEIKKEELIEGSMAWKKDNANGYIEVAAAANGSTYYNLSQTKEYPMVQELEEDGKTPKTDKDGNYIMIPEDEAKVEIGYKTSPNSFEIKEETPDNNYFKFSGLNDKNKPQYEQLPNKYYDLDNNEDFLKSIYIQILPKDRKYNIPTTDYREIIYQMAYDYYQHGDDPDYIQKISEDNPGLLKNGKTGYEQYYTDLQGFWRQLYNPDTVYDETTGQVFYDENGIKPFWNKKIHTDPNSLVFWFELLDLNEFNKYSVKKIGLRTKTDNQSTTTGIFYKETPEALFVYSGETIKNNDSAYTPLQLNQNMEDLFSRSAQGVSAIQRANQLIYDHTQLSEGISITAIPIYYLEPNTRIYVEGEGDCVLNSISYQLTYNGMMNLSCTKIISPFNNI